MKRCEWVSGLDLVDAATRRQVEVQIVELPIDTFEWQATFASFTEKP